jgi:hypothetical protein
MIRAAPASAGSSTGRRRGRGLVDATKIALLHPSAWPVSLAGFLVRGGILVFILPVVVLPTPTGLATLFGPDIISLALAAPTPGFLLFLAVTAFVLLAWLGTGSLVGAAVDTVLTSWVARRLVDPEGSAAGGLGGMPRLGLLVRVAAVRLACHLPLAVSAIWAVTRIVSAVYREYISPGDLSIALPLRVAMSVPDAIGLLLVAWLAGEVIGGLAARALVLEDCSMGDSLRAAVAAVVFHPLSAGASLLIGTAALVTLGGLPILAGAIAWARVRHELLGTMEPVPVVLGSIAFAALWFAALVLTGVATTWRSALWTSHAVRVRRAAPTAIAGTVTQQPTSPASA